MVKNLFLTFFCLFSLTLEATHIIGGEIYYDCLGNNQYRITVKVFRDCFLGQAPFDDPINLGIYNGNGNLVQNLTIPYPGSTVVPPIISNPCFQAPVNVCVEVAVYQRIVTLPVNVSGFYIVYQRCCRNNSIVNINSPGATGATYMAFIPPPNIADCNSSPRFNNFPPIVLCVGDVLNFDHSAIDPDGDQLVYSFCSPFEGASAQAPMPAPPGAPPYGFVNFIPPYTSNYALASNPAIQINPNTGQLTAVPTQIGQYVIGVCVEEFRNGQLVSTNKRDFQFNVVACESDLTVNFIAPISIVNQGEEPCKGLNVEFINLSLGANSFLWDFGVAGTNTDQSTLANPTFTFPTDGIYTVMLIANPGEPCTDTTFQIITLYNELLPVIQPQEPQCLLTNNFNFNLGGSLNANTSFSWNFGPSANIQTSTVQNPEGISFSEAGNYWVYVEVSTTLCNAKDSIEVSVFPPLPTEIELTPFTGCQPFVVNFTNSIPVSPGAEFYWTFGDGTSSTQQNPVHTYAQTGNYDVSLLIINTLGCADTAYVFENDLIKVLSKPTAGLSVSPSTVSILEPQVTFTNASIDDIGCKLLPGDGSIYNSCNILHSFSQPGDFIAMNIIVNDVGCKDTAYAAVTVLANVVIYVPDAFTPNGDGVNDGFRAFGEGIKSFEMLIFNRWGQQIFRSTDITTSWLGQDKSETDLAPSGIYSYRINYSDFYNIKRSKIGRVALVR